MMQRFLIISSIPEIRADPIEVNGGLGIEIEVVISVDTFWELQELIKDIRYARATGKSTAKMWKKFVKKVAPSIITEKDRSWFSANVVSKIK
ncbi:MAG: hypothetical protein K2X39_05435 [Silvanigrellaceae bacterium]|nr:hypothetical protein [Silvanigrellaceae bacterium]